MQMKVEVCYGGIEGWVEIEYKYMHVHGVYGAFSALAPSIKTPQRNSTSLRICGGAGTINDEAITSNRK